MKPLDLPRLARGLSVASGALVIAYLSSIVYSLFVRLGTSTVEAALAVFASVGVLASSALIVAVNPHNRLRALALIYIVVFSLVAIGLAGLEISFRQRLVAVPDVIRAVGEVGAMFLGVAGAVWAVTMLMAARVATDAPSMSAALSDYVAFVVKLLALGSSSLATAYFGASRGVPPVLSVFLAFILEATLIWAYVSLSAARTRGDVFDMGMWGAVVIAFGTLIAVISVDTVSSVSQIDVSWLGWLRESGDVIFVCAVGASVIVITVTHVLTSLVDIVPQRQAKQARQPKKQQKEQQQQLELEEDGDGE